MSSTTNVYQILWNEFRARHQDTRLADLPSALPVFQKEIDTAVERLAETTHFLNGADTAPAKATRTAPKASAKKEAKTKKESKAKTEKSAKSTSSGSPEARKERLYQVLPAEEDEGYDPKQLAEAVYGNARGVATHRIRGYLKELARAGRAVRADKEKDLWTKKGKETVAEEESDDEGGDE